MPSPISDKDLRRVCSGRWLIPILAHMHGEQGSRFGALVRALGLSRSVLSRHLDVLETFGWIVRNSGHGHPLRPEYLLSAEGRPIAAWCGQMIAVRKRLGLEREEFGRWSLPVVSRLRPGPLRFSELESALFPITPRALSLTLQHAQTKDLAERGVAQGPWRLTRRGSTLAEAMSA